MLKQIDDWSIRHHPQWLILPRVALGIALFIKGVEFIRNNSLLPQLIEKTSLTGVSGFLSAFIPWAHLFGGVMIVVGLFTRLAAALQIPILLGAVFFVNAKSGIFAVNSDLLFSLIILFLLIFFLIEGGGTFSLDHSFRGTSKKQ